MWDLVTSAGLCLDCLLLGLLHVSGCFTFSFLWFFLVAKQSVGRNECFSSGMLPFFFFFFFFYLILFEKRRMFRIFWKWNDGLCLNCVVSGSVNQVNVLIIWGFE